MIITRLTLENYKQYRGEHIVPISEDATVGVVGANGVGKTTIFEAIEWCLYKPASIRNADIRPRNTGGEVRVVVQMATQSGNEVYEVERILKRSATQATVYKLNELGGGDPVVQGTREVTDYITTKLIGLGHSAFVATFFTRQKELGFFDDLGRADRRREVGKLLGLETIKQAQGIIAEDRSRARADSDALQRRYDAQISGRDLDGEIEEITAAISERVEAVSISRKALSDAEVHLTEVEADNQRLQEQRDKDASLAAELRDHQSRRTSAVDRRSVIGQDLERLDAQQMERATLAPHAARLVELERKRTTLEVERERFQRNQRAHQESTRIVQELEGRVRELRAIVEHAEAGAGSPDWTWSDADNGSPIQAIDRLLVVANAVDVTAVEQRCGALREAMTAAEQVEREQATLETYHKTCEQLRQQVAELAADGDPSRLQREAHTRVEQLRSNLGAKRKEIDTLSAQQERSRTLIAQLELQHFDEACPTCGRPFDDAQAGLVISTMTDAIADRDSEINAARRAIRETTAAIQTAQGEIDVLRSRENALLEAQTRIANSAEHVARQEADVNRWREALETALRALSLSAAPTKREIETADRELARRRALHGTAQPLQMLRRNVHDALQRGEHAAQELATLTDISWDPDVYRTVTADYEQASRAASAIEQIDRQLARRPQLEHDLEATVRLISESQDVIAQLELARKEVAFNPAALHASNEALKAARQRDRGAREQLHIAERAKRESEYQLETIRKEQQQLVELAREAEDRRRTKEELDVMYSEFSEFDRFVAQHLSPRLSETTSDIVAEMTDGKYDRVTFDEDYGIEVFDQSEEGFALETFSGGERDVISLAARLALSRLIGQQAANPPGFLVLDEVFGSLDTDRRERVLTLLGQHSLDYFRQMFIISHVDDVQQSPVFDTIWQVAERADGSSHVVTSESILTEALTDE